MGMFGFMGTSEMPANVRVAIYNRCSSDKQEESLESQVKQSREIAEQLGWEIVDQYVDLASGTTIDKRTEYQRLYADMEKNRFDVVMVKSLDRLMRSSKDFYLFIDRLLKNNLKLYLYINHEWYEHEKSALLFSIVSCMNEQFSVELSKKIKNAHRVRQEKATGWNYSNVPFGFKKIDQKTYEIVEEEAHYIRRACDLLLEGESLYHISIRLYEEGLRTRKGAMMRDNVLKSILTSERLYGCVVMNRKQMNFYQKKQICMPKEEWVYAENVLPAIISKETWLLVQQKLVSNKATRNTFVHHKYELSGKIVCGRCGGLYHRFMYNKRKNNEIVERVAYWKCINAYSVPKGVDIHCENECLTESKLMEIIEQTSKTYLAGLWEDRNKVIDSMMFVVEKALKDASSLGDLASLKKELEKLKKKKEILFEKLISGVISDEDFKLFNHKLEQDIDAVQLKIGVLETKTGGLMRNKERLEKIRQTLVESDVIERVKADSICEFIEQIVVIGDGSLEIHWDKYKLLGIMNMSDDDNVCADDMFISKVEYKGFKKRKEQIQYEKDQIVELIRGGLTKASYSELGAEVGITKRECGARIKELFKNGIISRNEAGEFIVLE